MTNVDPEVINKLNELVEQRFRLEVEDEADTRQFKAVETQFIERQAARHTQVHQLDRRIRQFAEDNREQLITKGKSFVTMLAKFQFTDIPARTKVTDKRGILAAARLLGVVRKIAKIKVFWEVDTKKFLDWLQRNGEHREKFEPYIEDVPKRESLTIGPNANYTVFHDSKRISPPTIKIDDLSKS